LIWTFQAGQRRISRKISRIGNQTYLTLIILPDNAELNNALGDGDDLEGLAVLRLLLEKSGVLEGRGELCFGRND
jgi:hypothetical protein